MRALFPPWSTSALRAGLLLGAGLVIAIPGFLMVWVRTPLVTGQDQQLAQPVEFDHRHHTGDDGIHCLYCHDQAERSPHAGVPAASVCMHCHAQIWNDADMTEPIRRSFYEDRPIAWQRVTSLPDFVYFDHSIHLSRGVGCVTCHGRVDQMARAHRVSSLSMQWCLECHRDPALYLRPLEQVTAMDWAPDRSQAELGEQLVRELSIDPPVTTCSGCHR